MTVNTEAGNLNVRSVPSTGSLLARTILNGPRATVTCHVWGTQSG